jgi:hypothetical protein
MAQTKVLKTNKISIAASKLLFNPNWSGVKAALKIKFKAKGSTMIKGIFLLKASKKTFPKEINIKI